MWAKSVDSIYFLCFNCRMLKAILEIDNISYESLFGTSFSMFFRYHRPKKKTENHPRIPFSHINDDKHCYRNKNSSNMEIMYAERDILLYLTFFSLLVVFRFRGILLSLCRGWPTIDAVLYAIWKMRHS